MSQGFSWLISEPVLAAAFVAGAVMSGLLQILTPIPGPGLVINTIVGGLAFVAAERKVQDNPFDISAAFDEVADQLLPLILVSIGYAIAVFFGLLLFIIPGIYIGARLSLAPPSCVLDKQGVSDSFSDSWQLAQGSLGKIFGMFMIYGGVLVALSVVGFAIFGFGATANPAYILGTGAIGSIVGGAYSLGIGRVYLELR